MSRPPPGNYIIYSRILGPTGQKLAITFHGDDRFATVEPYGHQKNQVVRNPLFSVIISINHYRYLQWDLQNYDENTQAVVPVEATNLQAAWGDEGVKVLKAGNYVWTIRGSEEGYT